MLKRGSLVLAVIALLLVVGCSKPPEVEMQNANSSMQAAKGAEAEQYAPESFRVAMDTLNAANAAKEEQDGKFALFRSYGKSKDMFLSAQKLMDKAKADGEAEKERVKQAVAAMMTEVQATIDTATVALSKAPVGKGNKADIELIKSDLNSVNTGFAEAKADFDGGKYLAAKAKFEAVKNKAMSIISEIEAAKAKKAAPKK
jgi:hypothetical protein